MTLSLQNVFVQGAGRGIGFAFVEELLAKSAGQVYASYRSRGMAVRFRGNLVFVRPIFPSGANTKGVFSRRV